MRQDYRGYVKTNQDYRGYVKKDGKEKSRRYVRHKKNALSNDGAVTTRVNPIVGNSGISNKSISVNAKHQP